MAVKNWVREREEREEAEREEELESALLKRRLQKGGAPQKGRSGADGGLLHEAHIASQSGATEKLLELMDRVEPLMEQVHQLYSQFFNGVERLPPLERRKQLEQVMNTISMMAKPTQALRFRFRTVQTRFTSFCEQWDRKIRDLESGKLVRPVIRGR